MKGSWKPLKRKPFVAESFYEVRSHVEKFFFIPPSLLEIVENLSLLMHEKCVHSLNFFLKNRFIFFYEFIGLILEGKTLNKRSNNSFINFLLNLENFAFLWAWSLKAFDFDACFFFLIHRQWINRWNRIPSVDSQNTSTPWKRDPRRRWRSYTRFSGCFPVRFLCNIENSFNQDKNFIKAQRLELIWSS